MINTQVLTPSLLPTLETELAVAIKYFCDSAILLLNKDIVLLGILLRINLLETP